MGPGDGGPTVRLPCISVVSVCDVVCVFLSTSRHPHHCSAQIGPCTESDGGGKCWHRFWSMNGPWRWRSNSASPLHIGSFSMRRGVCVFVHKSTPASLFCPDRALY